MKRRELANQDIRKIIKDAGLRHFEVFDEMGISQATWTQLLCRPLSQSDREQILSIVERLSKELADKLY